MLLADKSQLAADNKVQLLTIQQSELDFHVSRCLTLGLQSTLVAALTYNGLIEIDDSAVKGKLLRLGYYGVTYAATGIELLVAFLTTYCVTRGPGLALRGPEGSIVESNACLLYTSPSPRDS